MDRDQADAAEQATRRSAAKSPSDTPAAGHDAAMQMIDSSAPARGLSLSGFRTTSIAARWMPSRFSEI
jgi:hypothetical protein